MDFVTTHRAAPAAIIACGRLPGGIASRPAAASSLPCYQALGPWGVPDAGLPWFRIGQAEGDHAGATASAAHLAGLLRRTEWLLLVIGSDHDALALALAIATYARGRGIPVLALLPARPALPDFQRDALARRVHYACDCPAGVDALLAAQALWRSIGYRRAGTEVAFTAGALAGTGRVSWHPLRDGPDSLGATLRALPALAARRCLWAVLLRRGGASLADCALAHDLLRAHCAEDATLVTAIPDAGHLPDGLFVFTA